LLAIALLSLLLSSLLHKHCVCDPVCVFVCESVFVFSVHWNFTRSSELGKFSARFAYLLRHRPENALELRGAGSLRSTIEGQ